MITLYVTQLADSKVSFQQARVRRNKIAFPRVISLRDITEKKNLLVQFSKSLENFRYTRRLRFSCARFRGHGRHIGKNDTQRSQYVRVCVCRARRLASGKEGGRGGKGGGRVTRLSGSGRLSRSSHSDIKT